MNPTVRQDILAVLKEAAPAAQRKDVAGLKALSDRTIHNSSIFQDEDSISVAVAVYSLSKMSERPAVSLGRASELLRHAARHLKAGEYGRYRVVLKRLIKFISKTDEQFRLYIQKVIELAQLRKGSRIYYHGISLAQAANLLGVSQWELMGYVGETQIIDRYPFIGGVRERLQFARELFGR